MDLQSGRVLMEKESLLPLLALLTPLFGSFLILLFGERRRNLREGTTLVISSLTLLWAFLMLEALNEGHILKKDLFELFPGLWFSFRADPFGMVFLLLSTSLWLIISIYSIGYMRSLNEHAQTRFFFCFSLAILGAIGVALSSNLASLFVFYEILTVSTFFLVAHEESPEALRAGRKYLVYLLSGASLGLFGIVYLWARYGNLSFLEGGFIGEVKDWALTFVFLVTFLGFGTKAALMPFHEWLPSAMIAPTPVSALLHAVAVVKAGVFTCLRILYFVFGAKDFPLGFLLGLSLFVSFTVIGANLLAIREDNLKRRLAFSTVNNLAVILLGGLMLSKEALKGAILHIPFHGFMKITLFMCAGSIYVSSKRERVSELDGIGHSMPFTMGAFTVAALGLCGIPPLCGFLSKWYLCLGTLEASKKWFLLVWLTSSFLDAVYFLPIVYRAFFKGKKDPMIKEAPLSMTIPLLLTALGSVVLGLFPNFLFHLLDLVKMVISSFWGV